MCTRIGVLAGLLLLGLLWIPASNAGEPFVVQDIRVEGLQRISPGTVFNYLPIKVGETLSDKRTGEAIRALFKTGFFKDVRLERDGNVLVVSVVERPSISSIKFEGNKALETDKLKDALKEKGFSEGQVFDQSVLEHTEQDLRQLYFSLGRYGAKVQTTVTPLERNRVVITFDVSEGVVARIKEITGGGAH